MNKLNKLFMILLSANSCVVLSKNEQSKNIQIKSEIIDSFDDSFKKHFEKMRQAHERMFQTMFADLNSELDSNFKSENKIKVNVDQDEKNVVIKISTEVEDSSMIKVDSEDGILTAIVPSKDGDIKLKVDGNYLKLRSRKEIRKEEKDKDGKTVSSFVEVGDVVHDQNLLAKVDINHVEASYSKENLEFVLKIEKKEKKSIAVITK